MKDLTTISAFNNIKTEYLLDFLTKAVTKEHMKYYMEDLISRNVPFCLFFFDIDSFKTINDTYGHIAGDRILSAVSKAVSESLENLGVLGRFGGDEFIIVLENITEYHDIWSAARCVCNSVRKISSNYIAEDDLTCNLSISLGASVFPRDEKTTDGLLEICDKALYRAKSKGKNCFVIYNEALHANIKNINGKTLDTTYLIDFIYETLQTDSKLSDKLEELFRFLGSYFFVDSITLNNEDTMKIIYKAENSEEPKFIPGELFFERMTKGSNIFAFNSRNALYKLAKNLYDCLYEQNIHSSVIVRCKYLNKNYGFVRFDMHRERVWTQEQKTVFLTLCEILTMYLVFNNEDLLSE